MRLASRSKLGRAVGLKRVEGLGLLFLLRFFKHRGGRDRRGRLVDDCKPRSIKDVDSRMCADTVWGSKLTSMVVVTGVPSALAAEASSTIPVYALYDLKSWTALAVCGISRGLFSVRSSEIHRGSEIFSLPDKCQIAD